MSRLPLVLCLLPVAFWVAGCTPPAAAPAKMEPPVVSVSQPTSIELTNNLYAEGYTAAVASVDIRSRVTGYLEKVYFQDGADVEQGAPLFLIDPRPYRATLDQVKAELARTKAQLKRSDADLARAEQLLPRRAISQEEYDRIAADRAQVAADVASREAAVEQADLNLHFAAIKAPISGRLSRALVTEGNLVTANTTLLTTLVSIRPVYAYFDIDEPTVLEVQKQIREGKVQSAREVKVPVFLALDIDKDYIHEGYIDFIENKVDPSTGTLKIRAVFENKDGALSPGLHVRVRAPIGQPYQALAVSDRAIGSSQGQKFVYLVNDKNEVVYRPVTVGALEKGMRVISQGVAAGDRVIVNGLQRVRPGVVVTPKPLEMAADTRTGSHESAGN